MMKRIYSYITVFVVISIVTILFYNLQNSTIDKKDVNETVYSLKVKEKDSFWIYEVYNNGALFISQEYIPAVKGKQVFKTKLDAEKIGKLVVNKLEKKMFPKINNDDLNKNNIYYNSI